MQSSVNLPGLCNFMKSFFLRQTWGVNQKASKALIEVLQENETKNTFLL